LTDFWHKLLIKKQFFTFHEVLEEYWLNLEPGNHKTKVQAMIQLAVSLYHHERGNQKGFLTLKKKALTKLKIPLNTYNDPAELFELLLSLLRQSRLS